MPRGRKRGHHRGGFKNFTNMEDLAAEDEKRKKEQQWRKKQGLPSDDEGSGEEDRGGAARGLPPSDSETESSSDEEGESKHKGVAHLIEVQNPNHVKAKVKKVSQLQLSGSDEEDSKPQLTRRQREEIEQKQAKERYMKKHLQGQTEEAQSDMARLAIIRKQREEAARRRDEEKKAKDEAKEAAEKKLLEKRKQQK